MKPTPPPPPPPPPKPYDAIVEYLESSGTQWIDTGLRATAISKIFIDFVGKSGGNYAVCGASNGTAWNQGELSIFWVNNTFDLIYPLAKNSSAAIKRGSYALGVRYSIIYESQEAIINEQEFENPAWSNEYVAEKTFFIGAVNRGTASSFPGRGLYYGFKMWNGDVLAGDFIPVRVGQVGYMYDKVSGQLFGNAGTGEFIIGPDVG